MTDQDLRNKPPILVPVVSYKNYQVIIESHTNNLMQGLLSRRRRERVTVLKNTQYTKRTATREVQFFYSLTCFVMVSAIVIISSTFSVKLLISK